MRRTHWSITTITLAWLGFPQVGVAQELPTVVLASSSVEAHAGTELAGSSPPGLDDRKFTSFQRLRTSADGSRWGLLTFTDTGDSATDEVLVVVGPSGGAFRSGAALVLDNASSVVVEGTTGYNDESGDVVQAMVSKFGLNDDGCYAILSDGAPSGDDIVAKACDGGPLDVMARRGDAVPNLGGPTYIGFAREPQIDNEGNVWFGMDTSESPNNRSIFMTSDGADTVRIVQEGVTIFGGQDGNAMEAFESLDFEFSQAMGGLRVSGDGQDLLVRCDTFGDTTRDDVLVFNGEVVVQEGISFADFVSPVAANGPTESTLAGNGDWYARGNNVDGTHWIARNGQVIAQTGDEVVPGSGEHFTTFSLISPGPNGDFVVVGQTDVANEAVLVYVPPPAVAFAIGRHEGTAALGEGARVLMRQFDPVDVNGDGMITLADASVAAFTNTGVVVLNDGTAVAGVALCTGACEGSQDFIGSATVALTPIQVLDVGAIKTDEVVVDDDLNGKPSPGDTLRYTIVVDNVGESVDEIRVVDTPDPNTALVVGSVTTGQGTVIEGNTTGDDSVEVGVGSLATDQMVTITYDVVILPAAASTTICNAAIVFGTTGSVATDDPDTVEDSDPTCTEVGESGASITFTKTASLTNDVDSDGLPSFGDTLTYTISAQNGQGVSAVPSATVEDRPDIAMAIESGSVMASKGTVVLGNAVGDLSIEVAIGDIDPGETVTITYSARIGFATDTQMVCNQAELLASGVGIAVSDDPDTEALLDPTCVDVTDRPPAGRSQPDPPPPLPVFCKGFEVTILGTVGDDTSILGTDGDDVIHGLSGNDTIDGGLGDDVICGGPGHDTLTGGQGADLICGNDGSDTIFGNEGDDVLLGDRRRDTIRGGPGMDLIDGGPGNDRLFGEDDDDEIFGGRGEDGLDGGEGNDLLVGQPDPDQLRGGPGDDDLFGGPASGDDDDTMFGEDGDDLLVGHASDDVMFGGPGNDGLFGTSGNDFMSGGVGNDDLVGASGADTISGEAGDDVIRGGRDDDDIVAGPEEADDPLTDRDVVRGGPGNDTIEGGVDDDFLRGGNGDDDLDGGLDTDECDGEQGTNDTAINCETVIDVP